MIKNFIVLLILSSIFYSCKRTYKEIGPDYYSAKEGFYVVNNSFTCNPSNPDFTVGPAVFQATFSSYVTWTISIKGLESGAVKTLTGNSTDLVSSGNSSWNGSNDGLYFFKQGEKVVASLTFLGSKLVLHDTVTIAKVKKFISSGNGIALGTDGGVYQEGFEGTVSFSSQIPWNYGIYSDGNEITTPIAANTKRDTMDPSNGEKPIQGMYAMTLKGKDGAGPSPYFVGGIQNVLTSSERASLPSNPDDVYLNIYVFGRGDANSQLNVGPEETGGEVFTQSIKLDFTGWKLFSYKLSQFPKTGGSGDGICNPNQIAKIGYNLISSPQGNAVEATFDMPTLTVGAPFNPAD